MDGTIDIGQEARSAASPTVTRTLLVALVMAAITTQMCGAMPTVAIPDMTAQLHAPVALVGLAHALCFLFGGIFAVVVTSYSDFADRRKLMIGSLAITCVGLVLAVVAPTIWVLMVARVLQAVSGAVFPLALRILGEVFPKEQFGRAMGIVTAAYGGIAGVDAVLAGWLTDNFGFRAVFGFMTLFAVCATVVCVRCLPRMDGRAAGRMDWRGAVVLSIALLAVELGIGMISSAPVTTVLTAVAIGIVVFGVFLFLESRHESPLIPVQYLRSRQAWPVLVTSAFAIAGVISIVNYTLPLLGQAAQAAQGGYGHSATAMALLFLLPFCAVSVAFSPLSGVLAPRLGWRRTLRGSLLVLIPLLVLIALFYHQQWVVFALLILVAPFNSAALTAINGLSVMLAPAEKPGLLPGVNSAFFGLGASMGVALAAQFVASSPADGSGYRSALWMSAVVTVLALLVAFAITGRRGSTAGRL